MDQSIDREQLEKRVAWLDSEHRNDKTVIAGLQSKIETLASENESLRSQVQALESDITRINTLMLRLETFEQDITSLQTETNRHFEGIRDDLYEKQVHTDRNNKEIEDMNADLLNIQKKLQEIEEIDLERTFKEHSEEEIRLARVIEEIRTQVNEITQFDEEYNRTLRMMEDNRRQDTKRINDIQGEVAALRKRHDETQAKQELLSDNMRKLETRFKGLSEAESERRESQAAFFEKINMIEVDRDRLFKQWAERFTQIEKITGGMEDQVTNLGNLQRSVKESQDALDEVTQRFERRINEITEVQRLNEDRFRQEWTTFKSDDQKRWSNYVISQDEQHREMNRAIDVFSNRLANIEDQLEIIQENLHQIGKDDIRRMQSLISTIRESIDQYNNIFKD